MGGLTALKLAYRKSEVIRSVVNIKGNLAPEDCFISRRIFNWHSEDMDNFLNYFIMRCRQSLFYSTALYVASIRQRVQVGAIRGNGTVVRRRRSTSQVFKSSIPKGFYFWRTARQSFLSPETGSCWSWGWLRFLVRAISPCILTLWLRGLLFKMLFRGLMANNLMATSKKQILG